jgi:LacI family transcriptional regulator
MRNSPKTDGVIHLNLFNQHWTRSMLPGIARMLRLYSEYALMNHPRDQASDILEQSNVRPAGFLGLVYGEDSKLREVLHSRDIPAVNMSGMDPPEEIPAVFVDNRAVGRMAAEHLLKLGPRQFACLDVGNNRLSNLRCEGFQERIRQEMPEAEVPRLGGNTKHFVTVIAALPRPLALFCATDNRARAAANAALNLGLKIPGDVAIVGVDNDPFECEMTRVPLSSVAIPFEEIGAKAMETLLALLRGEPPETWVQEIPPSHVVTRLSSDPMVFGDELVTRAVRVLRQPRAKPLNVAGLATALGVSRRTLEIRFRNAGAGTAHTLIHEMRMERAAALLKDSQLSVADVSRTIGIQDHRRFGQLFAERYGQTPGQFRRSAE